MVYERKRKGKRESQAANGKEREIILLMMSPNHMRRALGERWFGEVIHGSLGFYKKREQERYH